MMTTGADTTADRLAREFAAVRATLERQNSEDGDLIRRLYAEVGEYVGRVATLTRERDAARAALRDASRCDECGEWGTQRHAATGSLCCDEHATGGGWTDDPHAAALRAARVP